MLYAQTFAVNQEDEILFIIGFSHDETKIIAEDEYEELHIFDIDDEKIQEYSHEPLCTGFRWNRCGAHEIAVQAHTVLNLLRNAQGQYSQEDVDNNIEHLESLFDTYWDDIFTEAKSGDDDEDE